MLVNRIKEQAKKKDKNLKEVAVAIGLSENAIYKWTTQSPNSETLEKVADYFNVSTDYLLGRTDNPKVNNGDSVEQDSEDNFLVAAHMDDDLSEEELEEVRQYIEFLKSKHRK